MNRNRYPYFTYCIVIITVFYFITMAALLCLTPPIARDVLIHHLAIPKLWIMNGGFYEIPWAVHSYYPMNLDLLYLIPLYFGNDIIPNFIHLSFGLATALIICIYLRWRLTPIAGLLGLLIFISTPIIFKLSTMAYVDHGMVFFTTASVLAFIRWRAGKYQQSQWLVISSIAMGLALGTKYNALVPWLFLTLATVFIYAKDKTHPDKTVRYGFIFIMISLAVFSPWLIKNFILTGNPFYPLFPGIFNDTASENGLINVTGLGSAHIGMFKMRYLLYGENLWETLLIPFRMFFQGQDDSARYFDGVLNPILIAFVPFAFFKKSIQIENLLFLSFSMFVILIAFFLDMIKIRYILTTIPFLVILTVTGLMKLFEWFNLRGKILRKTGKSALVLIVFLLVGINAAYIQKYFSEIKPFNYLMNKESRDEFIARHDSSYPAIRYINHNTSGDSKIRLLFMAGKGYYLDRIYSDDRTMGGNVIMGMIEHSSNEEIFKKYIASLDCTYFLVRDDLLQTYLRDNYNPKQVRQLKKQFDHALKTIYDDHQYVIFSLRYQ